MSAEVKSDVILVGEIMSAVLVALRDIVKDEIPIAIKIDIKSSLDRLWEGAYLKGYDHGSSEMRTKIICDFQRGLHNILFPDEQQKGA